MIGLPRCTFYYRSTARHVELSDDKVAEMMNAIQNEFSRLRIPPHLPRACGSGREHQSQAGGQDHARAGALLRDLAQVFAQAQVRR